MRRQSFKCRSVGVAVNVLVITCVALLPVVQPRAGVEDAEALIRDVQDKVRERLQQESEALQSDLPGLYAIVDELIVPHVDVTTMSRLVLGQHWKKATEEQRARFAAEFSNLMVRTYARSLLGYDQYQVEFLPTVLGKREGRAIVRTELVSSAASSRLPVSFRMREKGGAWRVVDLIVNGISLVTTYRESFGAQVSGGGLEPLIAQLKEKNMQMNEAPE